MKGFSRGLGALVLPRLHALPARIFWLRVSILECRSLPTSSHLHRPKTPHFPLARGVSKPRDDDTKAKTCFLVVFHWSHAVPCPKSQGCQQKTGIEGAGYFLGGCFFWGGIEIVFLFIVVPCRPKPQKPRDVDQKDSKLGILLCWQSWVFLGQLGILG